MVVPTSTADVVKFLTDFDNYPNWFPRCKKARIVARLNENEFIAYLVFNAPWPVADRDCVIRVKVEKDEKTGVVILTETSEPKCVARQAECIRIEQLVSVWKMVPKDGGTEITNEYASNPGGNIPDWLINTQSVENPMVTFENLQGKVVTKK
jgi:ribosome-associated toxin RatA of RatAB toxin-antitoxin module